MTNVNVVVAGGTHLDRFLPRFGDQPELLDYLGGAGHIAYMIDYVFKGDATSLTTYLYDYPIGSFGSPHPKATSRHYAVPVTLHAYPRERGVEATVDRIERIYGPSPINFNGPGLQPTFQFVKRTPGAPVES